MKKLLVFMAIVACATFTQAAAILWQSASYGLVGSDGTTRQTSYSGGGEIVLALLGADAEDFSNAQFLQTGILVASGKASSYGKVSNTYEFVYGAEGAPSEGDYLAVLYKGSDGKYSQLMDASGTNPMYTPYQITGMSNNSWSATYNFATGNFQEPVPEPTSGLLLLMGGALLALRRKQK